MNMLRNGWKPLSNIHDQQHTTDVPARKSQAQRYEKYKSLPNRVYLCDIITLKYTMQICENSAA